MKQEQSDSSQWSESKAKETLNLIITHFCLLEYIQFSLKNATLLSNQTSSLPLPLVPPQGSQGMLSLFSISIAAKRQESALCSLVL